MAKQMGGKTMQLQSYTKNSADRLLFLHWLQHREIIEEVEFLLTYARHTPSSAHETLPALQLSLIHI